MKVNIIGGGIGGLTAAIALRARGIEVEVFEAAPELRPVGAGITMPANALQVFDRLGVADDVMRAGYRLRGGEILDARAGTLRAFDVEPFERRFGFGMVGIHRARLQAALAERLPSGAIHLGRRFVAAAETDRAVEARFDDGSTAVSDVLVGADGLRSAVRGGILPDAVIRYSGQTSHRGIARFRPPEPVVGRAREVWDAGHRFGFVPISDDEIYWFAVQDAPAGLTDPPGGALAGLRALFGDFPAPVPDLLARTPEETVVRTDIADLRPMAAWSRGRIVLLGDAAHATTPNLGQGGAQAVEDAWVLADRLAAHGGDHAAAVRDYERIRRPKALRIVRTSWWIGKIAHVRNPLERALRNAVFRATPTSASARQLAAAFELDY